MINLRKEYLNPKEVLDYYGYSEQDSVYFEGNIASSKNSKMIAFKEGIVKNANLIIKQKNKVGYWKNVIPHIRESELSSKCRVDLKKQILINKPKLLSLIAKKTKPVVIELFLIRKIDNRGDFNNLSQIVCDCLKEMQVLEDDNMKELIIIPPLPPRKTYEINSKYCGAILKVL